MFQGYFVLPWQSTSKAPSIEMLGKYKIGKLLRSVGNNA